MFGKRKPKPAFDDTEKTPAIRCSICTGEQAAGFLRKGTGTFEEVMLIRSPEELELFKSLYGIETVTKEY